MPAHQVHFQEVGSDDSILDIITVAVCLDFLHIDHIIFSPLYEGSGFTKCHHGLTAVPTPCTLRLVQSASIPMRITENKGEMILQPVQPLLQHWQIHLHCLQNSPLIK